MDVKPDMLVFNTWNDTVLKTKLFMGSNFEMKEMSDTSVILVVTLVQREITY